MKKIFMVLVLFSMSGFSSFNPEDLIDHEQLEITTDAEIEADIAANQAAQEQEIEDQIMADNAADRLIDPSLGTGEE